MNELKEHYVYKHLNPKNKEVFYIGVGKGHRVVDGGRHRNKSWQEYVYNNGGFCFEIVKKNLFKEDALILERELIKDYGLENLTNIVGEQGNSSAFKKGQTPWNKGLKNAQAPSHKKVVVNGVKYDSVKLAKKALGISNTTFYRRLNKKQINVIYIHDSNKKVA